MPKQRRQIRQPDPARHDQAIEDSFPASDPPASSGIVGPGGTSHRRDSETRPKGTPTDDRHAIETAEQREHERPQPRR
jgi:hypothetical protein